MIYADAATRQWKDTPYEGVEVCVLRRNDTGGFASLVKVAERSRVPLHDHPGGEELYVVHGRAVVGDVTLHAGDYLWTPPHGVHDLKAEEDTLLFVTAPNGVRILE